MDLRRQLGLLREFGESLSHDARAAGLEAPVPPCPGWVVRDLVDHVHYVHRWATGIVATRCETMPDDATTASWCTPVPDDELFDAFDAGVERLVATLADADDAFPYWSFLPADTPRGFWVRRQLHETVVHAADARAARGELLTAPSDCAVDGIRELLFGFAQRPRHRDLPELSTLGLDAHDTGDRWSLQLTPTQISAHAVVEPADCLVAANASDLYLQLWNRPVAPGALAVIGDPTVLANFTRVMKVRFS